MKRMKMMKMLIFGLVFALLLIPGMAFSGNVANVTQVGDLNVATVDQLGADNTANVSQYGRNWADVDQTGDRNTATVNQGSPGNPVNNYYRGGVGDWQHGAVIDQDGNDNTASIIMRSEPTGAKILQRGNRNSGSQDLAASQSKRVNPYYAIYIEQMGDDNRAVQTTVPSYGCYGIQNMLIQQHGNLNLGVQASIGGMASVMDIIQTGNSNDSFQHSDGRFSRTHASMVGNANITRQRQVSTVWATSGANLADIDIVGNANTATQNQLGETNQATINISGGGSNLATQTQTDNLNVASISQSGSGGNVAHQTQTGNSNNAGIIQNGDLNTGTQIQTGNSNYAQLTQTGDNNISSQTQTGNNHSSIVIQTGNWNLAAVVQGP